MRHRTSDRVAKSTGVAGRSPCRRRCRRITLYVDETSARVAGDANHLATTRQPAAPDPRADFVSGSRRSSSVLTASEPVGGVTVRDGASDQYSVPRW